MLFKKLPATSGHFPGQEKEEWRTKNSCFVTKAFSVYWKSTNFMADTKILGVFTTVCEKQLTALAHMLSSSHLEDPLLLPGPWRRMQQKHTPENSPAHLWLTLPSSGLVTQPAGCWEQQKTSLNEAKTRLRLTSRTTATVPISPRGCSSLAFLCL